MRGEGQSRNEGTTESIMMRWNRVMQNISSTAQGLLQFQLTRICHHCTLVQSRRHTADSQWRWDQYTPHRWKHNANRSDCRVEGTLYTIESLIILRALYIHPLSFLSLFLSLPSLSPSTPPFTPSLSLSFLLLSSTHNLLVKSNKNLRP